MRTFISLSVLLFISIHLSAQKPPVRSESLGSWLRVNNPILSSDGNFVIYSISSADGLTRDVIVQSIETNWKFVMAHVLDASFTSDSKAVIFRFLRDSIGVLKIRERVIDYFYDVKVYKVPKSGNTSWLAYQCNSVLKLRDCLTGIEEKFEGIKAFSFNNQGTFLLLEKFTQRSNGSRLEKVSLLTGHLDLIWSGQSLSSVTFSTSGNEVAFISSESDISSLYYYDLESSKLVKLLSDFALFAKEKMRLNGILGFAFEDDRLYFHVKKNLPIEEEKKEIVHVWSYTDTKLKSQLLNEGDNQRSYKCILNIASKKVVRLENDNEQAFQSGGNFELVLRNAGNIDGGEIHLYPGGIQTFHLVNHNTGEIIGLMTKNSMCYLSPLGDYVAFFDKDNLSYFSFNIQTRSYFNITNKIKTHWTNDERERSDDNNAVDVQAIHWIVQKSRTYIVLPDNYDLWLVDLSGKLPAVNWTGGYGLKASMKLRVSRKKQYSLLGNDRITLTGFNSKTKNSGLYWSEVSSNLDPKVLSEGPYIYSYLSPQIPDEKCFLFMRENEKESPNLFVANDLDKPVKLSNVHPENKYNWCSAELLTWQYKAGKNTQGILYKPENFDSTKKYPIIFYYYERMSDNAHRFTYPELSSGNINIPWFVSNGYLVFSPDIYYETGLPGESALLTMMSAVKMLSVKPYIDMKKMGLQGHSFGGFETNYIVTHTNSFAAAISACAVSDCISDYGSLRGNGAGKQGFYEIGQGRMGTDIWSNKELYIKNSPIFYADVLTTPLLMMANRNDGSVSFSQGVEFFTALRRLRKRAWMLEYVDEAHFLKSEASKFDYTMKVFDFFDHFLKDAPSPKWMITPFYKNRPNN